MLNIEAAADGLRFLHQDLTIAAVWSPRGFRPQLTGLFVPHHQARRIGRFVLSRGGGRVALTAVLVLGTAGAVKDATATNETRTLTFHHTHSGEDLTVTFKRNGRYDEAALKKINWLLRDWRSQEPHTMNPRLFDIVWEVYRDVDAKEPINIISAYRSPGTNAMLRRRSSGVARHSQHMLGNAMDFFIPGVSLEKIRFAGLRLQRGGVGFYPTSGSPFVHLDTGSIRHWPRMTHDQLVRVFPDERTVHVPSNGVPLKNYAQAMADIERRGERGDDAARGGAKSFLASLFGKGAKSDDDDESDTPAATPSQSASRTVAANAAPPDSRAVPLPRSRPVKVETFQVASLSSRDVAMPEAKPQSASAQARPARFTNPADIINARGFWDGATDAAKGAALMAASDPQATASVAADGFDDRAMARAKLAMAYAAADRNVLLEPAAKEAPTRITAKTSTSMSASDAAVFAAPMRAQITSAWNPAASATNDPWLRAMILAPNSQDFLSATQSGDGDMRTLAGLMQKPRSAVNIAFAAEANPGLSISQFTGAAVAFLPTVSFVMQTASLR